jgi:hypothetical protein
MEEIEAEPERAVYAISVANELLLSAQKKASKSSFEEAIIESRDSMRIASSAILFRDGYIANDLESSCIYLKKKYGDVVPVDEWRFVESMVQSSPIDSLVSKLGFGKTNREDQAKKAINAADRFISASGILLVE